MVSTNFSKSNPNSTGYQKSVGGDEFYLLLEDNSSFLLFEDGVSKLIIESGEVNNVNFSKSTVNSTNYSS